MKQKSKLAKKLKKFRKRTWFTIVSVFNLTWYCIAVLILSFHDHSVPDVLTEWWFKSWTAELVLLAGIKLKSKEE